MPEYVRPQLASTDPDARWEEMPEESRHAADRIWESVQDWIRTQFREDEDVGDLEIVRKLVGAMDQMVRDEGIVRPAIVMAYQAIRDRPSDPAELVERIEVQLMHIMSVASLYRECRAHQKWGRIPGPPGGARNLWEKRHEATSSVKRWEFVRQEMVRLGMMDEPPVWE